MRRRPRRFAFQRCHANGEHLRPSKAQPFQFGTDSSVRPRLSLQKLGFWDLAAIEMRHRAAIDERDVTILRLEAALVTEREGRVAAVRQEREAREEAVRQERVDREAAVLQEREAREAAVNQEREARVAAVNQEREAREAAANHQVCLFARLRLLNTRNLFDCHAGTKNRHSRVLLEWWRGCARRSRSSFIHK
jgi:hypothetical protein